VESTHQDTDDGNVVVSQRQDTVFHGPIMHMHTAANELIGYYNDVSIEGDASSFFDNSPSIHGGNFIHTKIRDEIPSFMLQFMHTAANEGPVIGCLR
jgi:hypothetical protein